MEKLTTRNYTQETVRMCYCGGCGEVVVVVAVCDGACGCSLFAMVVG